MGLIDFFQGVRAGKTTLPKFIAIPAEQTNRKEALSVPFSPWKQYFTVRINEMFLYQNRQWFTTYDPMVYILTEFDYNHKTIEHPYVVGRSTLKAKFPNLEDLPDNLLIQNTDVTGIFPYTGEKFGISIVLCQVEKDDYLKKGLQLVEEVSAVFSANVTRLLSGYMDGAKTIIKALDGFFDKKQIMPLVGMSRSYMQNQFMPGYFLLLDSPENKFDPAKFSVTDDQLYYAGANGKKEFRECSYVLYSIDPSDTRSREKLPFNTFFEEIMDYASNYPGMADNSPEKITVKGMLNKLNKMVELSPDLTNKHREDIMDEYVLKLDKLVNPKHKLSKEKSMPVQQETFFTKMESRIMKL